MFELLERMSGEQLLVLALILGFVIVLTVLILMGFWNAMHTKSVRATLQRDMLARGMSVSDVERLSLSELERRERTEYEHKMHEAQVAADLRRDLLARGLTAEQVLQLVPQQGKDVEALVNVICRMSDGVDRVGVSRLLEVSLDRVGSRTDAESLASAICQMAPDGCLKRDAVAGVIDLVRKPVAPAPGMSTP
jgi:hypothetical protein